ncbi:MAG: hypothetical protein R8P61_27375 [Bacteroidia bacterium]|nr:hypothetical protein [Bacteroidia bacterium]
MKGNFLLSCLLLILISFLLQPRNFSEEKLDRIPESGSPELFLPKQPSPSILNEVHPVDGIYYHVDSLKMES